MIICFENFHKFFEIKRKNKFYILIKHMYYPIPSSIIIVVFIIINKSSEYIQDEWQTYIKTFIVFTCLSAFVFKRVLQLAILFNYIVRDMTFQGQRSLPVTWLLLWRKLCFYHKAVFLLFLASQHQLHTLINITEKLYIIYKRVR